jgi:CrcB protein
MLLLMLGGALGTYLRYRVGRWFASQPWGQGFPYGTLVINVSGSFILGAAVVLFLEASTQPNWYLLIGVGFCGGYTTFSTFEWETYKLVRDGSHWRALANVTVSVVAGFVGVVLGVFLVSGFAPRP